MPQTEWENIYSRNASKNKGNVDWRGYNIVAFIRLFNGETWDLVPWSAKSFSAEALDKHLCRRSTLLRVSRPPFPESLKPCEGHRLPNNILAKHAPWIANAWHIFTHCLNDWTIWYHLMCGYLCLARNRLRFPSHHLLVNTFFLDCLNVLGNMEMAEGAAREGLLTKEFQSM